jgi:NAD(P)-dependent dehydrogenase (short-subunit alcohol dehydrogenase family)
MRTRTDTFLADVEAKPDSPEAGAPSAQLVSCIVAVFLVSDASKYTTGQCITVDGGYLASI